MYSLTGSVWCTIAGEIVTKQIAFKKVRTKKWAAVVNYTLAALQDALRLKIITILSKETREK